ncbi:MAG: histone deacetylase [bacterium]|nr:histone deacetylase [bacterium]
MGRTAYLTSDVFLEHDTGYGHPERAERINAIDNKLRSAPYYNDLVRVKPCIRDMKYIEAIHSKSYIKDTRSQIEKGAPHLDSMDNPVCTRSYDVALQAVGGSLEMCDTIMKGDAVNGFCAVRPPGHHAEKEYAAGFCIFNNIAIAAKYLQSEYGVGNIAIIDWDVHHGNGTQHSFEQDRSIYYISTHQFPHYPGTGSLHEKGRGRGKGYTLNIPMEAGSSDTDYLRAFNKLIIPVLDTFKPEVLLISAGFDAHKLDPLSSIRLTTDGYYQFTRLLMEAAGKYSKNRVIAFLEGGYNLDALANGVEKMMSAFIKEV